MLRDAHGSTRTESNPCMISIQFDSDPATHGESREDHPNRPGRDKEPSRAKPTHYDLHNAHHSSLHIDSIFVYIHYA